MEISTVFLGLDANIFGRGPPLLFETITFACNATGRIGASAKYRCATWLEAEAQHARAVRVAHEIAYPERYLDPK